MFLYRELLIALLISLASIVLADIIVQPGYTHQYGNYPQHQIVPQTKSPTEKYRSKAYNAHTYPSYKPYETNAKYFIGYPRHRHYPHYPHYHHRPYYPSNPHRLHFAKIGGRGYEKPSVYLGYPKPFIVHSRRKRSFESNPANIESSKIKITEKDNDVAAKSPVIDIKNLAVDDSLLPENEPTDTNDKRVVKRQVGVNNPFLSDGITTAYYHPVILNTMKDILRTRHPGIHFVPVREKTPEQEETPTNGYRIISNEPTILHSMSETDDDSQYRDALNTEKKISTEEFTSAIENVNLHLPSGVYRVWNPKGEDSQLNEPSYPEYRSLDARMCGMAPSTRTEQVWRSNYNSNYRDAEDADDVEDVEDAINQKPTAEQILSLMALIRTLWPKTHPFFVNTEEQVKAFQTRAAHQEMYPSQAITNTATPRQLKFSLLTPYYSEELANVYAESPNIKATPTFTQYSHNWDKNNNQPLNTYTTPNTNYDFGWNNQYIDFGTNPPTLHKYPYYIPKQVLGEILTTSSRYSPSMISEI